MDAKHTAGPWVLDGDSGYGDLNGCRIIAEREPQYVIAVTIGDVPSLAREVAANSRLIAAAPDLLGALQWYADQLCEFGISDEGCGKFDDDLCAGCKARAAIAKAIGEA